MINVSKAYRNQIKQNGRRFSARGKISFSDGRTADLTGDSFMQGGVQFSDCTSASNEFDVGTAAVGKATITLKNYDGCWNGYDFTGAVITLATGLLLPDGTTEWLEKGIFTVYDPVTLGGVVVEVTAKDNMQKFDRKYDSALTYPATLAEILRDACTRCGVVLSTQEFLNDDYSVAARPSNDATTYRDIVSYVAQLAGSWARINNLGELVLGWYDTDRFYQEYTVLQSFSYDNSLLYAYDDVGWTANGKEPASCDGMIKTVKVITNPYFNSQEFPEAKVEFALLTLDKDGTVKSFEKVASFDATPKTETSYLTNIPIKAGQILLAKGIGFQPSSIQESYFWAKGWPADADSDNPVIGHAMTDYPLSAPIEFNIVTEPDTLDGNDELTANGNPAVFDAYPNTAIRKLNSTGNTTLDGSGNASPGNIRTIHGVEYIEKWEGMSAENRNQCAPNYFKRQEWYGYIMSDGTIYPNDTLDLHSDYIHINPEYGEMQFTIFEFATHGDPIVGFYQSDKTYISRTSLPSTGTAPLVTSIPIPSNAAYVRFCIANPNYYGGKYKVEFGTVATDYSVAPEDLPSYQKIMLPQPLYNLPNGAADSYEVIGATGTEKIKKVILDGSKIGNNYWVYSNSENDTSICYGAPSGVLNGRLAGIGNSYCDKFQYAGESSNWQHGDMRESYWPHTSQSDYLLIRINKSRLSGWSDSWTNAEKVEAFKTWLSSNPVTILYELATPVAITGTPQSVTASADTTVTADNGGQVEVTYNTPDGDNADGGDFKWYNTKKLDGGAFIVPDPAVSLGPANRYDFKIDDNPVTVTGIVYEAQDKDYVIGDRSYALHITDNALIQGDPTDVLERIADAMIGFTYLPFTSSWQGNPALQPGDIIQQTDRNGVSYRTIVTNSTYIYRGVCDLSAKGASEIAHGFQSQQTKRATQLLRLIHEKEVKISSLDQAILNATSLIAGALGSHWIDGDKLPDEKYHGNVFIADNADITKAKKVWRWNLGGFGHSNNGVDGPYTAAITADDSIVANLVTASMIKTGRLESLTNPNVYFDLDEGVLCASRLVSSEDGATDVAAKIGTLTYSDGYKGKGLLLSSQQMPGGFFLIMQNEKDSLGSYKTDAASTGDLALRSNTESGEASNALEMFNDANNHGTIRFNRATGNGEHETAFSAEDAFFMLGHGNNSLVITDNGQYFSNGSYGTVDLRKADGGVFTLCLDGGIATNG